MLNELKTKKLSQLFSQNSSGEFGFGNTRNASGQRILNKDGTSNFKRIGEPRFNAVNIFHSLITMSWWKFNILVFGFYFLLNLLFTFAYYFLSPDAIAGMIYTSEKEKFLEIFYFSSQSLTTVGYGRLNPTGSIAGTIASIESMMGLLGFALATGLLYGRFSRPTAKLLYSENVLISPYHHPIYSINAPTALMFRIANARRNQLIEVEATLLFSYNETKNGVIQRRYANLKLEIPKINLLALSWTIVHPINEESPLRDLTEKDLEALDVEIMVNIKAIDDTYVQQIFDRSSYHWEEIKWDVKFATMIGVDQHGATTLDLKKISKLENIVN
jgi:inward rectifier potassium channel